jgi:hypothetical protein
VTQPAVSVGVAPDTQGAPRQSSWLANQNARIDRKVADGPMSKAEAAKLRSNDHAIRQEERDMAKQNGGHLTKQEQKTLKQQENANSKQIAEH